MVILLTFKVYNIIYISIYNHRVAVSNFKTISINILLINIFSKICTTENNKQYIFVTQPSTDHGDYYLSLLYLYFIIINFQIKVTE